jgi:hypothetical protein
LERWDLKLAGTDTLPFLSILFSKVDKNIFFIYHKFHIWEYMGEYGFFTLVSIRSFRRIFHCLI